MSNSDWWLDPPDEAIYSDCDQCGGSFNTDEELTAVKAGTYTNYYCDDCMKRNLEDQKAEDGSMNIVEKLDTLAEYQTQRDLLEEHKKEAVRLAFPADVQMVLADIEAEFSGKAIMVDANIQDLREEIKADVLYLGETVTGSHYQAVWSKGKTTWDSKELTKLLVRYPTLVVAKKTGNPSVALRPV